MSDFWLSCFCIYVMIACFAILCGIVAFRCLIAWRVVCASLLLSCSSAANYNYFSGASLLLLLLLLSLPLLLLVAGGPDILTNTSCISYMSYMSYIPYMCCVWPRTWCRCDWSSRRAPGTGRAACGRRSRPSPPWRAPACLG